MMQDFACDWELLNPFKKDYNPKERMNSCARNDVVRCGGDRF